LVEAGWPEETVEAIVAERLDYGLPSEGDNPGIANHVVRNLDRLCGDVELIMSQLGYSSHDNVVRGVDPVSGPSAAMSPVMLTDEAVISVSTFFFRYCGLVARAFARTLLIDPHHWDVGEFSVTSDRAKLREKPELLLYWFQILTSFAVTGTNVLVQYKPCASYEVLLMEQVAYGMEIHAIAHEYGHHHIGHGRDISEDPQITEFEADDFAVRISSMLESKLIMGIPNPYLGSGAGASILLKSLELLQLHSEAIGVSEGAATGSHPAIAERIDRFKNLGLMEPERLAAYTSFRSAVARIFNAVESECEFMRGVLPAEYYENLREFHQTAHPPRRPGFL